MPYSLAQQASNNAIYMMCNDFLQLMKSSLRLLLATAVFVAGCGQSGDLYLPDNPQTQPPMLPGEEPPEDPEATETRSSDA